jgi:hypothetical protein
MSGLKFPHLFTPIQAAGTLFRNRLFASPQGYYNIGPDLFPNDDMAAFYEIKAKVVLRPSAWETAWSIGKTDGGSTGSFPWTTKGCSRALQRSQEP